MPELTVIVPSRGRPEAAHELAEAFWSTFTADTELVFALDGDDETAGDYPQQGCRIVFALAPSTMVKTLNYAALLTAAPPHGCSQVAPPFAIGFMGDDHRPRTVGWDGLYLDGLRKLGTGLVYGDDLFQHERLPSQIAMTTDIVRALGYMAPEGFRHLFVDDWWMALGKAAGCITYLPDAVIEHLHPYAGKADWDPGYVRVNDQAVHDADQAEYARAMWSGEMARDAGKVLELRAAR